MRGETHPRRGSSLYRSVLRRTEVVTYRTEDETGCRLPATSGAAFLNSCVWFGNRIEQFVKMRDQLIVDSIAIGSKISCVHGIRIIVVRCLVAEGNKNQLWSWTTSRPIDTRNDAIIPCLCPVTVSV